MIKFCVQQWDKNKHLLENDIRKNSDDYKRIDYKEFVKALVALVYNESSDYNYEDERFDTEKITEINDGDYQGTMLYLIPRKTYQPGASDYLMTTVDYGSCSGCDTLEAAQTESEEYFVKGMMDLALHLVQKTIKPYNDGWRNEELFEEVAGTEPD